jgi:hypothetical protein
MMQDNEEVLKRINRIVDELYEFGVDAAFIAYTYSLDGDTRWSNTRVGNEFAIRGLLETCLMESKASIEEPIKFEYTPKEDYGDE